jgi:hypothetical protein
MKLLKGGKSDPAGTPLLPGSEYTVSYENVVVTEACLRKLKAAQDAAPNEEKYFKFKAWLHFANLKRWQEQGHHFHYLSGQGSSHCTCGLSLNKNSKGDEEIAVVISRDVATKLESLELDEIQVVRNHKNLPSLRGISVALIVDYIWRDDLNSYLWTAMCQECGDLVVEVPNGQAKVFVIEHNKKCRPLIPRENG